MTESYDPNQPGHREAYTVLAMVAVLHERGYERLRIVPGLSASGMYWRCAVTHRGNITREHGALPQEYWQDSAHYSSSDEDCYFAWDDARSDTPAQLADRFMARFPEIVALGRGEDPEYVAWYLTMLEFARRGEFPVAYSDWDVDRSDRWLPTTRGVESGLRMPPV